MTPFCGAEAFGKWQLCAWVRHKFWCDEPCPAPRQETACSSSLRCEPLPVTQLSLCFKFLRQVTLGKVIPQKGHGSNQFGMSMNDNKDRVCGYAGIKPGCRARTLLSSTVNNGDLTEWVLQPGREGIPLVLSFVHIPTSNKCFIHASKNGLCCDRIRQMPLMCCIKEGVAFTWNSICRNKQNLEVSVFSVQRQWSVLWNNCMRLDSLMGARQKLPKLSSWLVNVWMSF